MRFTHQLPKGIHLNDFKLPEIGLANPQSVMDLAVSSTRLQNIQKSMSRTNVAFPTISNELLQQAKLKFNDILYQERTRRGQQMAPANSIPDTIPLDSLHIILSSVGIEISDFELDGIKGQLFERDIQQLAFADLVEIIAFIESEAKVFEEFSEEKYEN